LSVRERGHTAFAVLRVDRFHGPSVAPEVCVKVVRVVRTLEAAMRDVERLQAIAKADVHYYWQATHWLDDDAERV